MHTTSYETLNNILDGMVEGVITINSRGLIQTFNKSAEDMFGYLSDEVIDKNISILMSEAERDHHDQYIQNYQDTGEENIIGIGRNVIGVKKNGDTLPLHLSIREYPGKVNGEQWYIGSCLDITLQKKQEVQLLNSVKMEGIGKLTSGIAHDYNNMLNVILGFGELLQEKLTDHPTLLDYTHQIIHAASRGSDLTRKLLSLSKETTGSETVVDINKVLQSDYKILQRTLTAHITIDLKLAKGLWPVFCDQGSLEDAILNMSINAKHAMPEGGTLTFSTDNVRIGSVESQILQIDPGDYVKLTISDSGIGMNSEVASHIFEPFFSTKDENGTGLGLSQVYQYIKHAKGAINVYSEEGYGSSFSIYIPRWMTTENALDASEYVPNLCEIGYENILVVDDEPALRELMGTILSSAGYTVVLARDGIQALDLLATHKIDLVVSDVIMPEMDGYELAHIIQHTYPHIKVQLTSGFSEDRGKTVTNEKLFNTILHKPYTSEELLEKIANLVK